MYHPSEETRLPLLSFRSLVVFLSSGTIIFVGLLVVIEFARQDKAHLRLGNTEDRVSGLVVSNENRLLILNTGNRSEVRSFSGRVARPWEPNPSAVLVSSSEEAASGLWEYLQIAHPKQVIVAGIPGAAMTWEAVLDLCSTRGVAVDYVTRASTIHLEPFTLTVLVAEEDSHGSAVVIRRNSVNAFMLLEGEPPGIFSQLTIGSATTAANNLSTLSIDTGSEIIDSDIVQLNITKSEIARIYFGAGNVRVQGGNVQR